MTGITNGTFTSPDWTYYKYPRSLSPIPLSMKPGMIVVCVFSILSCSASLSLLGFLTFRFISGRNDRQTPLYKNQYMLLIFQLVLADFQRDLGFVLDVMWLQKGQIVAPSTECFVQAWFLNFGDLGSGFFVFAIACHTFYNVVCGRKIGIVGLLRCSAGLWILAVILTVIPIILHPKDIFVAQGIWCSINARYETLRLYFHYIWVFIAQGAVLLMYGTTFVVLRKRMGTILRQLTETSENTRSNSNTKKRKPTQSKISRATTYMILYPLIYIITTLPLAAGRIASMKGHPPTRQYLAGAGTLMACGGWMNCLLYSLTRHIFSTERLNPNQESRKSNIVGASAVMRSVDGVIVFGEPGGQYREMPSSVASATNVVMSGIEREGDIEEGKDGVVMQTTWDVRVEDVKSLEKAKSGSGMGHRTFVTY